MDTIYTNTTKYEYLLNNLNNVYNKINYFCKKYNRNPLDIKLIAVSKGQTSDKIEVLIKAGVVNFGENYYQELEKKYNALKNYNINWHFIGNLQSNKIKKIMNIANEIQTISSIKHVQYIAKYAKNYNKIPYPVYIEINFAHEPQKSGITPKEGEILAKEIIKNYPQIKLEGIMCVPPLIYNDDNNNKEIEIPTLYKQIKDYATHIGVTKISLGMSSDIGIAIATGSTCLRIGTAIFGKREYTKF